MYFAELLNSYGSVLSVQDIWNMVGPSKVDRRKKFQQGFCLVLGKRRNVADKRAARRESFQDLRMKASSCFRMLPWWIRRIACGSERSTSATLCLGTEVGTEV